MKTQRINFTVSTTPWEGVEKFVVDVVIADLKYLFVRETKVVMANITEYKIEFASSSNITIDQPSYATYEGVLFGKWKNNKERWYVLP